MNAKDLIDLGTTELSPSEYVLTLKDNTAGIVRTPEGLFYVLFFQDRNLKRPVTRYAGASPVQCNVCGGVDYSIGNEVVFCTDPKCIETKIKDKYEGDRADSVRKAKEFYDFNMKNDGSMIADDAKVGKRHRLCTMENFKGNHGILNWLIIPTDNLVLQSKGSGNGKTHLAIGAMKRFVLERAKRLLKTRARFVSCGELLSRVKACYNDDSNITDSEIIDIFCGYDILIIDDIGAEKTSDFVQQTVYTIVNRRLDDMKPTIFTTNLTSKQIADHYGSRTLSRICSGHMEIMTGDDARLTGKF